MRCHCFLSDCPKTIASPNNCLSIPLFENIFVEDVAFSSSVDLHFTKKGSSPCDIQYCSKVSIFGSVDKITTLSVEVSSDKINWYGAGISYKITALQFHMFFETGCRYVRLISSGESTITALCSAKM